MANSRIVLLVAVLVMFTGWAVFAQTSLTTKTFGGFLATRTVTIERADHTPDNFDVERRNEGGSTASSTVGYDPRKVNVLPIGESAIASSGVETGCLVLYWDTTNLTPVVLYKNATGTVYRTFLSTATTVAP